MIREKLVQFDIFVDHEKRESGVMCEVELPKFKEPEAEKDVELIKQKVSELGELLANTIDKYTIDRCCECGCDAEDIHERLANFIANTLNKIIHESPQPEN